MCELFIFAFEILKQTSKMHGRFQQLKTPCAMAACVLQGLTPVIPWVFKVVIAVVPEVCLFMTTAFMQESLFSPLLLFPFLSSVSHFCCWPWLQSAGSWSSPYVQSPRLQCLLSAQPTAQNASVNLVHVALDFITNTLNSWARMEDLTHL